MNNIVYDFISFIKSLNFIDAMFITCILGLLILIVILIYIIKINDEEELEEENVKIINKDSVEEDELDLLEITKEIDENAIKPVDLNEYEKEQEEKAIISYDELLKTKDLKEDINYIKEQELGDLTVKSVDVESITKPIELPKISENVTRSSRREEIIDDFEEEKKNNKTILISYEKEEEFLKALKILEQSLN